MANAILYNQGSHPAGALKSGTMSLNVSPSLNIGSLKWRNGLENNNMWVIYSDTYSQGQATQGNALPTIWASPTFTNVGLINLINTLPARAGQVPFTDVTAATSWLRGQGVYFLSNQNYPQIITSGLTMMMDAGFTASFPNGGTSIFDVSGNDYVGNMINGPSWSNSGTTSFINFDGSDDYILVSNNANILSKNSYTKIVWFNASTFSTANNIISGGNSGQHAFWLAGTDKLNAGHNGNWSTVQSTSILSLNTWYYGAVTFDTTNGWKLYLNGAQESTSSSTATFNGESEILIGAYGNASNLFTGKIANSIVYNRVLSQSEILQNYYKGPIVTSGLTIMLDAGNVVSYGGTGTSWKDLTNNGNNMNMVNGMVYNQTNGGELYMDGGDEYLQIPPSTNLGNLFSANSFTITVIAKSDDDVYPRSRFPIYVNGTVTFQGFSQSVGWSAGHSTSNTSLEIRCGDGTNTNIGTVAHTVQQSTVYHRTFVIDRTNGVKTSYYVNGVLQGSLNFTNITGPIYTGTGSDFVNGFVFGYVYGWRFIGGVYNIMVHNRALSANEVQQNYNAQKGRFGI